MKHCLVGMAFLGCLLPIAGFAEIELSGSVRNDAYLTLRGNQRLVNDVVETKLLLQKNAEAWKFYSDLRVDLYSGDNVPVRPEAALGTDYITVRLLRVFVRYFTEAGEFSIGKTYVNFGVASVFNPFELDRNVNISDLNYTKSGKVALVYEVPLNSLSSAKVFISPGAEQTSAATGFGLATHLGSFDLGWVGIREGLNDNRTGVYFKGDVELGVQGAWAYHLDDQGGNVFSEMNLGVDYSFGEGDIVATVLGYYNGRPTAADPELLDLTLNNLRFFTDKYYLYGNVTYVVDQFFNLRLDTFVNMQDDSALLVPAAHWVLADGLSLDLMGVLPTGVGHTEFSRERLGECSVLLRVEAKL